MKKLAKRNGRVGFGWMPGLPDNRDHLYSAPLAKLRVLPTKGRQLRAKEAISPYSYLHTDNLSDDFWTIRLVH
jgi:hypothetical protein